MKHVFLDSSVWIEYFRRNECGFGDFVDEMLLQDNTFCNGIVLAEVLRGVRSQKEYSLVSDTLLGLRLLDDTSEVCLRAGEIGYQIRRTGYTLPLADLIIAAQCERYGLVLYSLDRHFEYLTDFLPHGWISPTK